MSAFEETDDDVQRRFAENIFIGTGHGSSREEAKEMAFENAWERAKGAGKQGKPLRVAAEWVSGTNPITWYRVKLVDDNP